MLSETKVSFNLRLPLKPSWKPIHVHGCR
uniref:Uncharacterized protein n=1 Tax=Tetranychus urticae TaxID=32264 RepID=T1JZM3_TETUR